MAERLWKLQDFRERKIVVMNKSTSPWFYAMQRQALIKIEPIDIHSAWITLTYAGREKADRDIPPG